MGKHINWRCSDCYQIFKIDDETPEPLEELGKNEKNIIEKYVDDVVMVMNEMMKENNV